MSDRYLSHVLSRFCSFSWFSWSSAPSCLNTLVCLSSLPSFLLYSHGQLRSAGPIQCFNFPPPLGHPGASGWTLSYPQQNLSHQPLLGAARSKSYSPRSSGRTASALSHWAGLMHFLLYNLAFDVSSIGFPDLTSLHKIVHRIFPKNCSKLWVLVFLPCG